MTRKPKNKPKTYSGCIKFPVSGAENQVQFNASCEFLGDFADPVKRHQIFKRPRKFRMEIWIRLKDKPEYEVSQLFLPTTGVDRKQLAELLYHHAVQDIKELAEREEVDVKQSFFKVIL